MFEFISFLSQTVFQSPPLPLNGAPAATVRKAVRIHSVAGAAEQSAPGNVLLNLSISVQNCNSLNLTTNVHSYELKLAAIKELNTDIIFLCDTRLVSNKGVSGANRLRTSLRDSKGKKYDLFANSSANSRKVAILADSSLQLAPVRTYSGDIPIFLFPMYYCPLFYCPIFLFPICLK